MGRKKSNQTNKQNTHTFCFASSMWHFPSIILLWLVAYNINILFPHLFGRGRRYQMTCGQFPHRPPCLLCGVHGALHVWRCAWQRYMMLMCICQPPCFESLALGCDGIIYFLIPPPGFTSLSVGLCCATSLLCCLQQTCLEFRPDFLSSSSCFSFHSRHMCLEDFLEWATRLRISELPHFWTW